MHAAQAHIWVVWGAQAGAGAVPALDCGVTVRIRVARITVRLSTNLTYWSMPHNNGGVWVVSEMKYDQDNFHLIAEQKIESERAWPTTAEKSHRGREPEFGRECRSTWTGKWEKHLEKGHVFWK